MHNLFGLWGKTWLISIFNASTLFLSGETCERKPGLLNKYIYIIEKNVQLYNKLIYCTRVMPFVLLSM